MSAASVPAFVGLGSNLEKPIQQVRTAMRELGELPGTRRVRNSHLYRSVPLGPPGQPDYINAVAMLRTSLDAHALLDELQALENRHGRVRKERWGPRTLDLDLLLFGEARFDSPRLSVPHPQMHRRAFVLVPLHDVAPGIDLPDLGPLADHVRRMSGHGLQVVGEDEDD